MTPEQLRHAAAQIENPEIQARVLRRSLDYGKEQEPMKTKRHIGRIAVGTVAAVLALSVTAFAAVRSQVEVLWADPAIEDLAEAQQTLRETGSKLALPEELGDYTFAGANVTRQMTAEEQTDTPENGQVLEGENGMVFVLNGEQSESGVSCVYRKGDEEVSLDTVKLDDLLYDQTAEECDVVELEGQTFYCSEGDTVTATMATAEDGVVSSTESQGGTYRSVAWEQDGVYYSLSQLDGSLTREDLIDMALELLR